MSEKVKALSDHRGQFGFFEKGKEYEASDPMVAKAVSEDSPIFKESQSEDDKKSSKTTVKRGSKKAETASESTGNTKESR